VAMVNNNDYNIAGGCIHSYFPWYERNNDSDVHKGWYIGVSWYFYEIKDGGDGYLDRYVFSWCG